MKWRVPFIKNANIQEHVVDEIVTIIKTMAERKNIGEIYGEK